MIRFLLDENFNGKIVRGLRARQPDVDMIRVQDTELSGTDDPTLSSPSCSIGNRS
jgi:hypothetical protein